MHFYHLHSFFSRISCSWTHTLCSLENGDSIYLWTSLPDFSFPFPTLLPESGLRSKRQLSGYRANVPASSWFFSFTVRVLALEASLLWLLVIICWGHLWGQCCHQSHQSLRAYSVAHPSPSSRRETADGSSNFRSWDVVYERASDLAKPILPPVYVSDSLISLIVLPECPSVGLGWNDPELTELHLILGTYHLISQAPAKTVPTKTVFRYNRPDCL